MTQTGWKFICTKCGYISYGEKSPSVCFRCKATDSFERLDE